MKQSTSMMGTKLLKQKELENNTNDVHIMSFSSI